MNIWGHCMVKNEARWLWFSVASIVEHIDKLLLWDTGSTDETLKIIQELKTKYPEKILFRERKILDSKDFTNIRQEMLDETKSDWFLMLDGDEIWWEDSIAKVIETVNKDDKNIESVVVPTINLVGDIFHFQEKKAGKYKFGDRVGHYNLRAVKRSIPGLHSQGVHGVWGWADVENKQIQDRQTYKFVDAPYLHTSFLGRGGSREEDRNVIKRTKKLKYELGKNFPLDFYYPEVFFKQRPENIESPWQTMSPIFKRRASIETPARFIKRRLVRSGAGY